jgi:glycosyltransferase involved in cell wall biosynthesis
MSKKIIKIFLNKFPFLKKIAISIFSFFGFLRPFFINRRDVFSNNSRPDSKNKKKSVVSEITAIIKTFESPESLDRLIRSIRKFYPDLEILVADDSRYPQGRKDVAYYIMPFDSGLSAGRNLLLSQVNTPYFLLLDDDYVFDNDTKLEVFLEIIKKGFDIVGGEWKNDISYHGILVKDKDVLYQKREHRGFFQEHELYDIVHNFFLGRTETVYRVGWDNNLKIVEHTDFFLRAKEVLKITYTNDVKIMHKRDKRNINYKIYRDRTVKYSSLFIKKHGIKKVIGFDGG